ncbi:hypothetical protein Tco_1157005 [Tanacetum coccineum]
MNGSIGAVNRLQLLVTRPFGNGLALTMLGLILYSLQMPAVMTGSLPVKFVFVETTFEPVKRLIGAQAATFAVVKAADIESSS